MPSREPVLRKLGQNVRDKREARDISQEDLAEQANLDLTYIVGNPGYPATSWTTPSS